MPTNDITKAISDIDAKIAVKRQQINELLASAQEWERQSKIPCSGYAFKKQLDACKLDRTNKANTGAQRRENAASLEREIAELTVSKNNLIEQQKSENSMGISLANQGISQPAAIIKAEGEAKAALAASQIKSTAEADAISKKAGSSSMNTTIIVGAVSLIVVVLAVVLVKKYAGKKPVKK